MFGEYEYIEGFLDIMCKFFPYMDAWVEDMQKGCGPNTHSYPTVTLLYVVLGN